jgi:hypothetical protein
MGMMENFNLFQIFIVFTHQFKPNLSRIQEKEFGKIWGKFEETRSEKYVIFGGTFADFFRILFGKFVWMSSKFGFNYEVLL